MRAPRIARDVAVRNTQIVAFVRMSPVTVLTQFIAAAVLVAMFLETVDLAWLALWFASVTGLCLHRLVRVLRLRFDRDYARAYPPSMAGISIAVAALAVLWLVPVFFWFDTADPTQRLFLCLTVAALMTAGTLTLVSVPPAAILYLFTMAIAAIVITLELGTVPMLFLILVYVGMLTASVIVNARHFIDHIRARFALEERGEIVDLLREFQAAGSGGLWELNRDLKVVKMSIELAEAIGRTVDELIGISCGDLLDPGGRARQYSSGMRTLFGHFEHGTSFRDLAVPALESGRWWSLSGKPIRDDGGAIIGWRGVGSDITELRLSGENAVRAARRDPLTGLANRLLVREHLEEALLAQLDCQRACSLFVVDLDRFKLVNDTLGHAVGDKLLCEVARRLEQSAGRFSYVGRLGGDEFAVVVLGEQTDERLGALAQGIIAGLSRSFTLGITRLHIGATIGIARGGIDGQAEEALMRAADLALYHAKEEGRGGFAYFEPEMYVRAENNRLLENDVRAALEEDRLSLSYQPIIDARTGTLVGREALMRWMHPTRGAIPPGQFIPIIEDAGLIHQIGDWVIREACREAANWPPSIRVAVNISVSQLSGSGLAETVLGALASSGLAPARLELEVTESIFLGDDLATLASLERLRALGARLVLDDFGKGYSSFGYLTRAKFAKIKIEQTFVRGAAEGERDCLAIVHAIIALARGLDIETTAEGVETEGQAAAMRALGCNELQGFYFGRPVPAGQFADEAIDDPLRKLA